MPIRSILLVDDDPGVLSFLSAVFARDGWEVHQALSAEDALRAWELRHPDVTLLDLHLPGLSGMRALEILVARGAAVAVLTGDADVATAVDAMREGAYTYLTKPVSVEALREAARGAAEQAARTRLGAAPAGSTVAEGSLFGPSPRMREMEREIGVLATARDTTVLLLGESGTGKSWLAERLHALSPRASAPFVEVNCASLSSAFLSSELFGHERGAFTDAKEAKRGLFEIADRGTLFLDEIGDLSPELQPKLLRVLETRSFRRLGGTREIKVDVRLVAATNRDLSAAVRAGTFREDLFYRLSVFPITVPPLRDRAAEDVHALLQTTIHDLAPRVPGAPTRLSDRALQQLLRHPWPGNARELRNAVERALVLARGSESLEPHHLPQSVRQASGAAPRRETGAITTLEEMEIGHIARALLMTGGNRTETAKLLGISRATLHVKIKDHGLEDVGRAPARPSARRLATAER
ncbi:MAG TPA: sigma-54 dependent transcriptional regulator [Longimicrobium sp.]|nr:sigma-54 dependent transcriptional regulator [Longimicrobium sp.]